MEITDKGIKIECVEDSMAITLCNMKLIELLKKGIESGELKYDKDMDKKINDLSNKISEKMTEEIVDGISDEDLIPEVVPEVIWRIYVTSLINFITSFIPTEEAERYIFSAAQSETEDLILKNMAQQMKEEVLKKMFLEAIMGNKDADKSDKDKKEYEKGYA